MNNTPNPTSGVEVSIDQIIQKMTQEIATLTNRAVMAEVARDAALARISDLEAQAATTDEPGA